MSSLQLNNRRIHLAPVCYFSLAVWLLSALLSYGKFELPAGCKVSGQAESSAGEVQVLADDKANSVRLEGWMSADAPGFILKGKTGKIDALNFTFRNDQNQALFLNLAAHDLTVLRADIFRVVVAFDAQLSGGHPQTAGCRSFVRRLELNKSVGVLRCEDLWELERGNTFESALVSDAPSVELPLPTRALIKRDGLQLEFTIESSAIGREVETHPDRTPKGLDHQISRLVWQP